MNNIKKIAIVALMLITLTGCDEKLTYSYLVQHPHVLKHEISDCLAAGVKDKNDVAECEIVMAAADKVNKIIEEQQSNPEKFGQQVIDAQMAYAKSQEVLQKVQQSAIDLKSKNASPSEWQAADAVAVMAKKIVDDKREELKIYLAVIGLNTPE